VSRGSAPDPDPRPGGVPPEPADGASATRPLHILHIIPTLGVGGTERQLVKLLLRMDPRRTRHTVCYYTRTPHLEADLNAAGIRTIFFDKFAMRPWSFFARLRRTVRETRPDVVHTWLYSGNFWGRLAALSCGVRRLVASDRGEAPRAPAAVRLYERLLAPLTLRLVNSRATAASLVKAYGIPPAGIRVVANAVEEATPVPGARDAVRASLGLPPGQRLVLLVARQSVEKNHAMFFRAARRVAAARPDVTFVAAGHLVDPGAMQRVLEASGAGAAVRLVGEQADIPRWLLAADVFCLTSDREGLPNALLEAMAAGLPIVCTRFPSATEVLSSEGLGVLVPVNDDASLAAAILALLGDDERRRAMGRAARDHVAVAYGWDRLLREMDAIYAGLDPRRAPAGGSASRRGA
jgi:glycosyltransferase involved in cell wall biosynthesis